MLIIEIALGILLGFILLANLDTFIAMLGAGLAGVIFFCFVIIVVGGFAWFFAEHPNAAIMSGSVMIFFVAVGGFGALISQKTRLTFEEAFGSVLVLVVLGFALFSMWEEYRKYGDVTEEAIRIAPFLLLVLALAGVLAKRVHDRKNQNSAE